MLKITMDLSVSTQGLIAGTGKVKEQKRIVKVDLFRAAHVIHDIRFFRELGTPVDKLIAMSGLPENVEEYPEEYVSLKQAYLFRRLSNNIEKIEDLGPALFGGDCDLHLSPKFVRMSYRFRSLIELLRDMQRCLVYEGNTAHMRISFKESICRVSFDVSKALRRGDDSGVASWQRILTIIKVCRLAGGPDWRPSSVDWPDFGTEKKSKLLAVLGSRVIFCDDRLGISFPKEDLVIGPRDHSHGRPGRSLFSNCARTGSLEPDHPSDDGFIDNIILLLRPYVGGGFPSISEVAELCGTSTRTLQRYLARNGTNLRNLMRTCRFQMAHELLRDSQIKITDVAISVGYEDPAHFSRAFRLKTGMTPKEYRKHLLRSSDPAFPI